MEYTYTLPERLRQKTFTRSKSHTREAIWIRICTSSGKIYLQYPLTIIIIIIVLKFYKEKPLLKCYIIIIFRGNIDAIGRKAKKKVTSTEDRDLVTWLELVHSCGGPHEYSFVRYALRTSCGLLCLVSGFRLIWILPRFFFFNFAFVSQSSPALHPRFRDLI